MISASHLGKRPVAFFVAAIAVFFIGLFLAAAATAPVITSGPAEGSTVATSSVSFTFDAPGAMAIQCTLAAAPGGVPYACGSPQNFTLLGDSVYIFEVAAQDALGDWATTTRNFTVNTIPITITASAGANGLIAPSGAVVLGAGSDQTFTITPDSGFDIADVLVDGVSVGATTSYMFVGATTSRTISASFSAIPAPPAPAPTPAPAPVVLGGGNPAIIGLVSDGYGGFSSPVSGTASESIALTPPPFSPGIPSTGELPNPQNSFIFSQTLKLGSRGEDVMKLQERLMSLGLFDHPVATGYFGPITARAVNALQLRNNLPQVGVVGPLTRNVLNSMGVAAR